MRSFSRYHGLLMLRPTPTPGDWPILHLLYPFSLAPSRRVAYLLFLLMIGWVPSVLCGVSTWMLVVIGGGVGQSVVLLFDPLGEALRSYAV